MERKFRITVDGQAFHVTVEELSADNTLYPTPGSMQLPAASALAVPSASGGPSAATPPGAVLSSLGGVVEGVHVRLGEAVVAGQTLLTIEAMKMKNAIVASQAGVVRAIAVKPGDTVDAGQVLLELG